MIDFLPALPAVAGPRWLRWLRPGLPALVLLGSAGATQAQDSILKQDNTRIEAKVLEITEEMVRYKRFDFQDGPTYSIRKSEVVMIVYKNGRKETFNPPPPAPAPASPPPPAPAEPAPAAAPPAAGGAGPGKNPLRVMGSAGLYGLDGGLTGAGAVELVGANEKIGFLSKFSNAGLGGAFHALLDLSHDAADGERLVYDKYYLSAYAFKEFDGRRGTLGLLLGPGFNYTNATRYVYPDYSQPSQQISTGFFTVGVQAGQYVQKYLWKNSAGHQTGFVRLGFNQFLMLKGSLGSSFLITVGI